MTHCSFPFGGADTDSSSGKHYDNDRGQYKITDERDTCAAHI